MRSAEASERMFNVDCPGLPGDYTATVSLAEGIPKRCLL